ncbi:hypothetical protein FB480_103419 [Agrobacterium vitis]|nr:hypothetical protein FB480_103419 [Agrobacterium vitis]
MTFLVTTISAIIWVCWYNPESLGRWLAKVDKARKPPP